MAPVNGTQPLYELLAILAISIIFGIVLLAREFGNYQNNDDDEV